MSPPQDQVKYLEKHISLLKCGWRAIFFLMPGDLKMKIWQNLCFSKQELKTRAVTGMCSDPQDPILKGTVVLV